MRHCLHSESETVLEFLLYGLNLPSVLLVHLIWPIQYSDGSSGETKRHEQFLPMHGMPSHRYSYSWAWACWTTTVHIPNAAVLLFNSRNEVLASCAALPDGSAALLLLSTAFGSAGAAGERVFAGAFEVITAPPTGDATVNLSRAAASGAATRQPR